MQTLVKRVILLAALTVGICAAPLFAQEYELNPYAGGLSMGSYHNVLDFKNPAIFGLKGGAYVTDHLMIEGNGAWINQFNFSGYDYRTGGVLWEAAGSYNFYQVHHSGVVPFGIFGVGGLTFKIRSGENKNNGNEAVFVIPLATPQPTAGPIPRTLTTLVLANNDTFLTFSYGGGVKAQRLWKAFGLRADIRGRTIPNFFGKSQTALEATGGVLFSWGER
jgi:hypothetical protein